LRSLKRLLYAYFASTTMISMLTMADGGDDNITITKIKMVTEIDLASYDDNFY